MTPMLKILVKDLDELWSRPYLLAWLFVGALVFLFIAGNLNTREGEVKILLVEDATAKPTVGDVEALLGEFANISVVRLKQKPRDLVAAMGEVDADLAIMWDGGWAVYDGTRPGRRRGEMQALAYEIAASVRACTPWQLLAARLVAGSGQLGQSSGKDTGQCPSERAKRPLPETSEDSSSQSSTTDITPSSATVSVLALHGGGNLSMKWLVPAFVALITIFLPFFLACNSIAREQELDTLDPLLVTPGISWPSLIVGKSLLPILVGVVAFSILLLFAQTWFAIPVRPGALNIFALQFLAILASASLGLLIAALIRNQLQGYFASAAYLLASILLTGFLYPKENAADVIRFLSPALPLTWSYEPLANWMLSGSNGLELSGSYFALCVEILGFTLLAAGAFRYARRRI
jgi:ABC-type multidrug transport system permease subunit